MTTAELLQGLENLLGRAGFLSDPAARLVYARDASHITRGRPLAVAIPANQGELQKVLELCHAAGVSVVPRGAGTGLSGGAVPTADSIVLSTGRLQGNGPIDRVQGRITTEAGVVNEAVSRLAAHSGFHFAPDPSSQSAAVVGGNIANNAGGPHCLRHGVTLQHLAHLRWYDARGRAHGTGHGAVGERGLDLVSLLCGSEGTLGLVGEADLRLVPNAAGVATLLAFFPELDHATGAVVTLLGQGLLPVAVEIVDQAMLVAVEAAFGFGFPTDVAAAMIVEFNGSTAAVVEDGQAAAELLGRGGAREVRLAADAVERANLWMCRKKAFGAVGRLAPSYVTMDVVVPLGELPDLVREIQIIKARHEVEIATAFHAGDGNLHPGVHYDDRDPAATARAHAAADEIIAAALARGGSATGEHGVGLEKIHALPWQLDAVAGRLHQAVKEAFDPDGLLNPGKLLPDSGARFADLKPLPDQIVCRPESLTISAPVTADLAAIQGQALAHGLWLPVGLPGAGNSFGLDRDPTLGEILAHVATGPALLATGLVRDFLLESWLEMGTGEVFRSGAPVFKNVAGYDFHHALCGSGDVYARHLAATLQLRPCPQRVVGLRLTALAGRPVDLEPLWAWLAARRLDLAAPQVVLDPAGDNWLFVAGRDRDWDLGRIPADLNSVLGPVGWRAEQEFSIPFGPETFAFARDILPSWALAGPDWTLLAPLFGADWCPDAAELPKRIIRQGLRHHLWAADIVPASGGWLADAVVADNVIKQAGPPAPGVPRELLRRLKSVFDPEGRLATPEWLAARAVAGD